MIFDVAILGGGVVGSAIFNKLTRRNLKCVLIEKGNDVAVGTSKANSGIVHAGFDAKTGSLKAQLNVRGAEIFPTLCDELHVPYIRNGAVVIGDNEDVVKELYIRGVENNVNGLKVLNRSELKEKLPNIADNITCGLFAETSAIVSPYKLTIALAEEAVLNGGYVIFNFDTKKYRKVSKHYMISNGRDEIFAKKIIIAVGANHNNVAKVFGATQYDIKYRRGEYYLLDKGAMNTNGLTVFPLPSSSSKGILVTPTTSGNIIVGPTSTPTDEILPVTTHEGLEEIAQKSGSMLKNINLKSNIRVFSGVRTLVGDDFVIEKDKNNPDIINVTGICSPGLTASPAIAEYVADMIGANKKEKNMKRRPITPSLQTSTTEEINQLIKKDKRYGKIICRCENISEMEIINAINSPLKPCSLDSIKRRTRAGMGRCQGGFCFLKVMEIIAREYHVSLDTILKENEDSRIIVGDISNERL